MGKDKRSGNTVAGESIASLTRDLCRFSTGVVAADNQAFFKRVARELNLKLLRYKSGREVNGWRVPDLWTVKQALIQKGGKVVFDGSKHPLAVGWYSKSFKGFLNFRDLERHVVTRPKLPSAYSYHCMWQIRQWEADWAFSIPYRIFRNFKDGKYKVDLETSYEKGEMLVGVYEHRGASKQTVVLNAHTCHPQMANDDNAGVALLVRLFQWLRQRDTYYSYRLVLAPEHIGTVFYLHGLDRSERSRIVSSVFLDMPGTESPLKVASTFIGHLPIDRAFRNAGSHLDGKCLFVPWRQGAGNDETVWEAPGYEIPCVEVSRAFDLLDPFPEYHTDLDTAESLNRPHLAETLELFKEVVEILEGNATLRRSFNGLVCLSNPRYGLYQERPDPSVKKRLARDSEKWGYLQDCFLRYLDGSMSLLDIAERHDLPFREVAAFASKYVSARLARIKRAPLLIPQVKRSLKNTSRTGP